MAILEDLARAVEDYIVDSVSLSIVDVDPPGTIINVSEICPFQARVNNGGKLGMTDVSLEIQGLNGTLVGASNAGPWVSSITVNSMTVPAGAIRDTANLYFKAPATEKPAFTTLVNVHVKGWNGTLALLDNSSTEELGEYGHYMSQVHPS